MKKSHGQTMYTVSPISTKWAVFLGCTTVKRLSEEMGIDRHQARNRFDAALRVGYIKRAGKGFFRVAA